MSCPSSWNTTTTELLFQVNWGTHMTQMDIKCTNFDFSAKSQDSECTFINSKDAYIVSKYRTHTWTDSGQSFAFHTPSVQVFMPSHILYWHRYANTWTLGTPGQKNGVVHRHAYADVCRGPLLTHFSPHGPKPVCVCYGWTIKRP